MAKPTSLVRRIGGEPTEGTTKRVSTDALTDTGHMERAINIGSGFAATFDTWGGTWGSYPAGKNVWGGSWVVHRTAGEVGHTERVPTKPDSVTISNS